MQVFLTSCDNQKFFSIAFLGYFSAAERQDYESAVRCCMKGTCKSACLCHTLFYMQGTGISSSLWVWEGYGVEFLLENLQVSLGMRPISLSYDKVIFRFTWFLIFHLYPSVFIWDLITNIMFPRIDETSWKTEKYHVTGV